MTTSADYNIIEVDDFYSDINYNDRLIDDKINNDERLSKMKWNDAYNELCDTYDFKYSKVRDYIKKINIINIAYQLGYIDLARDSTINIFSKILKDFEINYDYISLKNDDNIYVFYNKEKGVENVTILDNNNNEYKLNPFLQYKVNKFKNKIKDFKLNKDLKFKLNGKEYNFSSNYLDEVIVNNKKEKKIYTKSDYFEKYKTRITDENIKKLEKDIKNKELNNKEFWNHYNKNKNINKNKINSLFKDDPVIEFDKELFYEKYKDKHFTSIYKNVLYKLDDLEKEYNNFKIIEYNYNKLKEDINITSVFKNESNKISKLFTDYENNRVNEYKVLLEIGNLFVNNKLSKEERKEINSINQNSRPARLLKQSQRVYILEEFVNIKNIALAGISNWIRDTSDDNFNILLSFFST